MYYIDTLSLENINTSREIIDIFSEMNQALEINNNIDASNYINNIINKYHFEFSIYNRFNPINNYPLEQRVKYIWQFLFAVAFQKIIDLKNKGNH